jgi:hypothetical protein
LLYNPKIGEIMPLTNNVIIKLNEITTMVEDKSKLSESDVDEKGMILMK